MIKQGFEPRMIEVGIINTDFIEIISGLKEVEEVYISSISINNNVNFSIQDMGGGMRMQGSEVTVDL